MKKFSNSNKSWTDSQLQTLVNLRKAGKNYATIAEALDRTPAACSSKYSSIKTGAVKLKPATTAIKQEVPVFTPSKKITVKLGNSIVTVTKDTVTITIE